MRVRAAVLAAASARVAGIPVPGEHAITRMVPTPATDLTIGRDVQRVRAATVICLPPEDGRKPDETTSSRYGLGRPGSSKGRSAGGGVALRRLHALGVPLPGADRGMFGRVAIAVAVALRKRNALGEN